MTSASSTPLRLMWAGFLGIFIWGTSAGLLGAVLPKLRERASLSLDGASWMFVALSAGLVVASLVAGPLLDRYGRKPVLLAAAGLVFGALLGLMVVIVPAGLLLLAFVLGAGGSALVTASHALIADLNPEYRASALNLLDVFFGVGAFATTYLIVPLQARGGIGIVLGILAGLTLAILLYIASVSFPRPAHVQQFSLGDATHVLASPLFLVPALLIFLYVGSEQSVWDWQVTYFMRRLEMNNEDAARLLGQFPVAILIGRLVNNRVLRLVAPGRVLIGSTLGAALCFGLLLSATTPWAASVGLFVCGLFMASLYPTTLGVLAGRFPGRSGTALGLAITFGWLGSFLISPLFGFVARRTDFWTAYLVVVTAAVAMVATAVTLVRQRSAATQPDVRQAERLERTAADLAARGHGGS